MVSTYHKHIPIPLGQQLARNIKEALSVAGPATAGRGSHPLRSVALQQSTGIARSTLRALVDGRQASGPNPDLNTLSRLADAMGIPVAFLIMRPDDWRTLSQAIDGLQAPSHAAGMLVERGAVPIPLDVPERILQRCGMHPEPVPYGLEKDGVAVAQVAERNEGRRRGSRVLAALMLGAADNYSQRVLLTALAASLANQLSYDRQRQQGAFDEKNKGNTCP